MMLSAMWMGGARGKRVQKEYSLVPPKRVQKEYSLPPELGNTELWYKSGARNLQVELD